MSEAFLLTSVCKDKLKSSKHIKADHFRPARETRFKMTFRCRTDSDPRILCSLAGNNVIVRLACFARTNALNRPCADPESFVCPLCYLPQNHCTKFN